MKRLNLYFSEKQIKNMKQLSRETGLSVAELVRRAVDSCVGSWKTRKK